VGIIDHGLEGSSREIYAHDFFGLLKKQYKNNFFTSGLAGIGKRPHTG
jgi:predicted alpha/beta-fold hydrolase